VVPSLADGPDLQPYALLRNGTIAARLRGAFMGRVAVWSGTPDVGSTNRAAKDNLLRNLATWAKPDSAGTHGPGVVALQDNSDDPAARYGWLGGISQLSLTADNTLDVYSNVQVLTTTGATILTGSGGLQIGYTNMGSYGLIASGASNDATGGRSTRVVLVTVAGEPSDPNLATINTDKDDYQPGDTVLVFGPPASQESLDRVFGARERPAAEAGEVFGEFTLEGSAPLQALASLYGLPVPEDAADISLADFLGERLGKQPVAGDRVPLGEVELVAQDVEHGQIRTVGIELEPEQRRLHQIDPRRIRDWFGGIVGWVRPRIFSERGQD
jgi:hypothetical protein